MNTLLFSQNMLENVILLRTTGKLISKTLRKIKPSKSQNVSYFSIDYRYKFFIVFNFNDS